MLGDRVMEIAAGFALAMTVWAGLAVTVWAGLAVTVWVGFAVTVWLVSARQESRPPV